MPDARLDLKLDIGEDGLISAIAQDTEADEVLMLAYVSAESLAETQSTDLAY